jgi:hypothetical protein
LTIRDCPVQAKSKFEPSAPLKKYTMKVIDAGADRLLT